jgi:hypothetical protein
MSSSESEFDFTHSPVKPFRFTFDTSVSNVHYNELVSQYQTLEERISRLINEPTIDGNPIIQFIFKMTDPEPNDLAICGRALIRLAEIYPEFQKLKEKISFMKYARLNPDVAALAFGDFDADIENLLNETSKENL